MDSGDEVNNQKKFKVESADDYNNPGDIQVCDSATDAMPEIHISDDDMDLVQSDESSGEHRSPLLKDVVEVKKVVAREIGTNNAVVVTNELLNHKGIQYGASDIAPRFKKDCRSWLWKGSKKTKEAYMQKMRELEDRGMPSSSGASSNRRN